MPGELVLLVDPDRDVQATVGTLLVHEGYRVVAAPDTAAALEAVRGQVPDVVIVDPAPAPRILTGHTVLRELGGLRGIPVIAVTADVIRFPVDRLLAEGYTAAQAKPCSPRTIARTVRRILDTRKGPAEAAEPPA
ncbi:MAG TPA: response regulator [Longimicrobium sp.]|nr:response regulator [Longimicrobium sp.]